MSFYEVCDEDFWNRSESWDTSIPLLSRCFRMTVLRIFPCLVLWLMAVPEVCSFGRNHGNRSGSSLNSRINRRISWSFVNSSRFLLAALLLILHVVEGILVWKDWYSYPRVERYTAIIMPTSLLFVIFILRTNLSQGIVRSPSLWCYFFVSSTCEAVNLHQLLSHAKKESEKIEFYAGLIYFPITLFLFFFVSIADKRPQFNEDSEVYPGDLASYPSHLTFTWTFPLTLKGWKKDLTRDDMFGLKEENKTEYIGKLFRGNLYYSNDKDFESTDETQRVNDVSLQELSLMQTNGGGEDDTEVITHHRRDPKKDRSVCHKKTRGVITATLKTMWFRLLCTGFLHFLYILLQLVRPLMLKWLLSFVKKEDGTELSPLWQGFLIIVLMFASSSLEIFIYSTYIFQMMTIGVNIRTALQTTIYRKAMTIGNVVRKKTTIGEIVNLMSVDADKADLFNLIHIVWSAPLQICLIIYLLYLELGISCFAGVAVVLLTIPINYYSSIVTEKAFSKQMEVKDERVKVMNEILSGMKVIKLYVWEEALMKNILSLRSKECKIIRRVVYLEQFYGFLWTIVPVLVSLASFATFVVIDEQNVLDAEKVFVSMSLFHLIQHPMSNFPDLITLLIMARVSVKRLNRFFNSSDLEKYVTKNPVSDDTVVSISDASFSWGVANETKEDFLAEVNTEEEGKKDTNPKKEDKNRLLENMEENEAETEIAPSSSTSDVISPFELTDLNLSIKRNSLTAVVGVVGSGKSSLLSAILGEMIKLKGSINIASNHAESIAYVSQQAWIQNMTLRDNILFAKAMDEDRYQKVLNVCELRPDLELLPASDLTEIGEKGINLSGGQKQRLSLARAIYSDSDLILLDDPLSAVDAHVGKKLFNNVLGNKKGVLRNKTRILVTNQLSILPKVDQIIVMKDGKVSEVGSYHELSGKTDGDFAEFLKTFSDTKEKSTSESEGHKTATDLLRQMSVKSQDDETAELKKHLTGEKDTLIEDEKMESGKVKWSVYYSYYKVLSCSTLVILLLLGVEGFQAGTDFWLAFWSQDRPMNVSGKFVVDQTLRDERLLVYGLLGSSSAICYFIGSLLLAKGSVDASIRLHDNLLHRILRSPMSFFETTPVGRIINRFSKDMDVLDVHLEEQVLYFLLIVLNIITTFVVIIFATPIFAAVIVPSVIIYLLIQKFYLATIRSITRLESVARSPIYSHFSETLNGTSTIRGYGKQMNFVNDSDSKIDNCLACSFTSMCVNRWLSIALGFLGDSFVAWAALFAVLLRGTLDPGLTGLSVTYAMNICGLLSWFVQTLAGLETEIVSVERILEYTRNQMEAEWKTSDPEQKPPEDWPSKGVIEFHSFSTRYRPGLHFILHDVSFQIQDKEKIGIVGRTGAGKSSLTLSLFRIIEAASGKIIIDGVDISNLGLHDLRSKLTIIPQDPVLFSGSMRFNLDPFNEKSDEDLWKSLDHCHLKDFVSGLEGGLDYKVSEGGGNLSVGQRQLLCIARSLLRKSKILVLDEATAAIDMETDSLIQQTIRSEFNDCTVLTIAHRIHSIMDSTRIMVLDAGKVVEFDAPQVLLQDHKSIFHSLATDAGIV